MSAKNKTKHNTRKTLLKGKSKKDLKELVVPLLKTPPTGGVVPPFAVFLHMRRNVMVVTVPLQRVPDKIVNYDASAERFLLDTTKFTRKPFYLEFTYPQGIKVEDGGEAKIENGIFTATLPLLAVPQSFQLKTDGMDVSATNESRKRKRTAEAAPQQQPKTAESPAKKTVKAKAKATGENSGEATAVAAKTKQPKKKKQKKASGESSEKQIDARAVSLDKAMGLIDELGAKEESQISEKLHKEKEKKAALNAKQREKRQKKQQKKDKIEQLVDELKKEKKEQEEEKKPLKKATPRKVSFGEPGKKAAKAGGSKSPKKPALKKTATKKN